MRKNDEGKKNVHIVIIFFGCIMAFSVISFSAFIIFAFWHHMSARNSLLFSHIFLSLSLSYSPSS
jgi:uncharacterized membrane protein